MPSKKSRPAIRYSDDILTIEAIPLPALAERVGTPVYIYSKAAMQAAYARYRDAFEGMDALVCYAVKANTNLSVIRTFADMGSGADVVSGGELRRALAAGVPARRIVFSGVAKTREEIDFALNADILQFNVESEPELKAISAAAMAFGRRARIAIRVNPDVDAGTHAKISTGLTENKFGIALNRALGVFREAKTLPGIDIQGVAVHIGSQLTSLAPYGLTFDRIAAFVGQLAAAGIKLSTIDVGGGLGIAYREDTGPIPTPADLAKLARERLGGLGCRLIVEPGRSLVGAAGLLLTRVIYEKHGGDRRFLILDGAMNDLMRPALYDAYHRIVPVVRTGAAETPADIVGPVCETGDTFARARPMPPLEPGDLVAILDAGAYGAVMASTYNARPLVPEVMVDGDSASIIRERPSHADMMALDSNRAIAFA
ncbi:diaminopimelate decarboxylase [Pseudokordiimonas caeni]|uniref:diaminopimelate decarboxylase n=1 Tax=Pseudokordiimonas caeni TaxID=2997908 RepID=UPI0028128333|nr:diaminopimelate decarboxylase [Pseudokordiimonas caeni]